MKFPNDFGDLAGLSFIDAHSRFPDFVDFTLKSMDSPTGLFFLWKNFCLKKK